MGEVSVPGLLQLETWASSAGFSHGLTWGSVWVETLGQVQLLSGWGCCRSSTSLVWAYLCAAERTVPATTLSAWEPPAGAAGGRDGSAGRLPEAPGPREAGACADTERQSTLAFLTSRLASQAPVTQACEGGWLWGMSQMGW